jgi:hypothetical protein
VNLAVFLLLLAAAVTAATLLMSLGADEDT